MTGENDNQNLNPNPQITDVDIGIRNLRKIVIYPLSMADQLSTTDLITEAMQTFFASKDEKDEEFIRVLVDLIKNNLGKIIGYATGGDEDGEELLKEITNEQAVDIAEILYDVNYENISKKVQGLLSRILDISSQLGKSSQLSPSSTDMDSISSTDDLSEKAD